MNGKGNNMQHKSVTTNDPLGLKAHYEAVIGESWSVLEKSVRSNPKNRWFFEMLDEMDMSEELEAERIEALPWWRKICQKLKTLTITKLFANP